MRIAILTTDNREHHRKYALSEPVFGPAIEALFQGLSLLPELEIHVISCTQKPMTAPEKLSDNTWFHLVNVPKIGWLRTAYQGCIRAIRRKLREIQPDIVHGQGTERECALGAVFSGFPNVITVHGNMVAIARSTKAPIGSYWWWAALLERFTLPRTCGVLCNSAYTESLVQRRAPRTWRVPNAVRREFFDTPAEARPKGSKPILLNIGVIGPHKRQLAVLDLAERLEQEGRSFDLQFIGPADRRSPYAATFLQRIEVAERNGFVKYLGTKSSPDLIGLLDTASALIHVPLEEAFGLVVAEALARNLKFFGAKIGGVPDIARVVEGAELFGLEDSDGLYSAITNWLRAGCPRPQSAADEMRRRYHPQVIAARHKEIYHELLAQVDRGEL
jgi:glycosyltransferase involved in cell wall biosynthesis